LYSHNGLWLIDLQQASQKMRRLRHNRKQVVFGYRTNIAVWTPPAWQLRLAMPKYHP
jgi:hypothetical protein